MSMTGALLTTNQAAALLKVKRVTVLSYLTRGLLPNAYRHGRDWCIPYTDVTNFRAPRNGRPRKSE